MKTKPGDTEQMTPGTDEHADLKAGLVYYLAGHFPALPHEVTRRIADEMVEGMLRAVREAEREETSNE